MSIILFDTFSMMVSRKTSQLENLMLERKLLLYYMDGK